MTAAKSRAPKPEKFDKNQMAALLKRCKTQVKQARPKPVEDDVPLQIKSDSSDEDDMNDEEDDIQMTVLVPPPPPAEFGYGASHQKSNSNSNSNSNSTSNSSSNSNSSSSSSSNGNSKSRPQNTHSNSNGSHNNKSKPMDKSKNIWTGSVKRSSSDTPFTLSLSFVSGKETRLKSVIPKSLQINGRLNFKQISSCLAG